MLVRSVLSFIYIINVAAQVNNTTVPTITPTLEPTTTFSPTAAPTRPPIPAPVPQRPCYTNLTEIEDLVKLKDPFILEKYILCPNTIYHISTKSTSDANTTTIGFRTIYTRSNSIYQCGIDGKSSNNCIIRGGDFQLRHEHIFYDYETKVNVVIRGLTFEAAEQGALLLASPGDITFIDCIFRNHSNLGVMPILYSYITDRRLKAIASVPNGIDMASHMMKYHHAILHDPIAFQKLKEDDARSHDQRRLQSGDNIELQTVTVDGCIFENNVQGPNTPMTINGVIFLATESNELVISNSIFRNNSFIEPTDGGNGFAIFVAEGAKINITNVCFTDNNFTGEGVVVIGGSVNDFVSKNVFGTVDPELTCSFASISAEICVDYDIASCTALNLEIESAHTVPTTAPITSPVATTSYGVSIRTELSLVVLLCSVALTL